MSDEPEVDFGKMKVADLKQELKKRGLSTEGKKNELIERLQTSIGDAALLDDTHDDLLDEDVLSDDEVLNDTAAESPTSPEPLTSPPKRPLEDPVVPERKKVVLNRKSVSELPVVTEPEPVAEGKSEEAATPPAEPPKAVKLVGVSAEERRLNRAVRFGAENTAPKAKAESNVIQKSGSNLDLLKKRAERFGTVAPALEKAEVEDRKQKRLLRFGGSATTTTSVTPTPTTKSSINKITFDDKKEMRAKRFQVAS